MSNKPNMGLDPRTLRSSPEPKADASPTEPPWCPRGILEKVNLRKYLSGCLRIRVKREKMDSKGHRETVVMKMPWGPLQ